jgi:hypothetical protein
VSVVGEGQGVEAGGGARVDLDGEPVEDAGARFRSAEPGVEEGGVPFVVEVVIGQRVTAVHEQAARVSGQQISRVLGGDREGSRRVVQPVGVAEHRVGGRHLVRSDVDGRAGSG